MIEICLARFETNEFCEFPRTISILIVGEDEDEGVYKLNFQNKFINSTFTNKFLCFVIYVFSDVFKNHVEL